MRSISQVRFNALAGYCRQPGTNFVYEELDWFEHADERVLGMLARDLADNDFGGIIYGRDYRGRFRAIYTTPKFQSSPLRAKVVIRREMERLALSSDEEFYQGDETGTPLDFFKPKVQQKLLNPIFLSLTDEKHTPARGILEPMMHWYEDPDGNFIEQFQTTGFDARLWELYLFAVFREMGYAINRMNAVPDFACEGIFGDFSVEALTLNPTRDKKGFIVPPPACDTPEAIDSFLYQYMPIRFNSALTAKLAKEYWLKPNVAGKPLLFAIQDFSAPGSMIFTRRALRLYLYGYDDKWKRDREGRLQAHPQRLTTHRWEGKEIRSGFFFLPGAENVSAVLFNSSGTISKFNRMGVVAGFGSSHVRITRVGLAAPNDPNAEQPVKFCHKVNAPDYMETWVEGLDVFHNPNAKYPIAQEMLPGAAHYHLLPDGQVVISQPAWYPLISVTQVTLEKKED